MSGAVPCITIPSTLLTDQNHIGAGVRYNARKSKVGAYYSTPIFAFRCKCHLCDGWFEIRTDPQNERYVVTEGARAKDETWDPAENGGYAVWDTEAPSASEPPADAFAHLEKTTDQATAAASTQGRLNELAALSDRAAADPYAVSRTLRDRFRADKKVALAKQARDEGIRERFGIAEGVDLGDEGVDGGSERWAAARENRGLPTDAGKGATLAKTIRANTARRWDAFGDDLGPPPPRKRLRVKYVDDDEDNDKPPPAPPKDVVAPASSGLGGLLAGYGSGSDSDSE